MKRIIAAIMVLVSVMTLSGCKEVPGFMPSYWDGLTKREAQEYIQDALQEKYGEEFVVRSMGIRSGQYYRQLEADCSPKSDKNIIFQIEATHFSENRTLRDGYIQGIVGKEMKNKLNSVISKYYSDYVLQVKVFGLESSYDSGIRSSAEASIERYTELVADNSSIIHIILNENEVPNFGGMERILEEYAPDLYKTSVLIRCYRVPKDILIECAKNTNDIMPDKDVTLVVSARYPEHDFYYNGEKGNLRFSDSFLCECSDCLQRN